MLMCKAYHEKIRHPKSNQGHSRRKEIDGWESTQVKLILDVIITNFTQELGPTQVAKPLTYDFCLLYPQLI